MTGMLRRVSSIDALEFPADSPEQGAVGDLGLLDPPLDQLDGIDGQEPSRSLEWLAQGGVPV